jgi:hypothetical protein
MNILFCRQSAATAEPLASYGGRPTASMNSRRAAHPTLSAIVCVIVGPIISHSFPNAFGILEVTSTPMGFDAWLPQKARA